MNKIMKHEMCQCEKIIILLDNGDTTFSWNYYNHKLPVLFFILYFFYFVGILNHSSMENCYKLQFSNVWVFIWHELLVSGSDTTLPRELNMDLTCKRKSNLGFFLSIHSTLSRIVILLNDLSELQFSWQSED